MGFWGWLRPDSAPVDAAATFEPAALPAADAGLARCGPCTVAIAGELQTSAPDDATAGAAAAKQVMAAWRRDGTGFTQSIDGVCAIALADGAQRHLYRDASSLQNAFWCHTAGGGIACASDLPALLAMNGVPRRLARPSLHEYLRFLDIAAPRTLFDGVHAVEPGQLLSWSGDILTARTVPPVPMETPQRFEDAVDLLDRRLRAAVEERLAGSVRPALFLSGGIDSALVAAVASSLRPDTVAVTVGFDVAELDETPLAGAIAAQLGLRHEVLRFGHPALRAAFDRAAAGMEQPTADPSLPATILALDHCREHFDLVLDGTGADEAVGAMPQRYLRFAVSVGSRVPTPLRRGLARALRAVPPLATHAPMFDFEHPAEPFIRWRGFSRVEVEQLCGTPVSFADTRFYRTFEQFPRRSHFERYSALVDAMPCERLNQAMRISGQRLRFPYADRQVDGFLRQLRVDFRDVPGQPKRILRALLARYLPRTLWDVPKRGFNFPLQQFLMADDARLVRRQLDPARWRGCGLLDAGEVDRHAREYIAGDQGRMFRVWALVVLGAWLDQHDDLRESPP